MAKTTNPLGGKKQKKRFLTQFDPEYKGKPMENESGEKLTQPDMSLTVQELLKNHTRGQEIDFSNQHYFETEIPEFEDITDKYAYIQELRDREAELKEQVQAEIEEFHAKKQAAMEKPTKVDLNEED